MRTGCVPQCERVGASRRFCVRLPGSKTVASAMPLISLYHLVWVNETSTVEHADNGTRKHNTIGTFNNFAHSFPDLFVRFRVFRGSKKEQERTLFIEYSPCATARLVRP
ncbi:hypothetical protein Pan241w_51920 [Gimesia alba]|uniref:Uncharacterized protein n=1 Tax=Gimesia alba TaxID=2527973 RepID=A0A517RMJ4_9PLAN|nr:hypothetical protein Pan241w_51920 [Gimesia alba]